MNMPKLAAAYGKSGAAPQALLRIEGLKTTKLVTKRGLVAAAAGFLMAYSWLPAQNAPTATNQPAGSEAASPGATSDEVVKMEAVRVTGSYIERSSFQDVGSPVALLTQVDMSKFGAITQPTDFTKFIPGNFGLANNDAGTSVGAGGFAVGQVGGGSIDLHGLGAGGTLVLLDGTREARYPFASDGAVDTNTLIPSIAIERMEILKDGASATYGTDAISGVVNFIPRANFEGAEIRGSYSYGTNLHDYQKKYAGFIMGTDANAKLHMVVAVEVAHTGPVREMDVINFNDPAILAVVGSSNAFPGNFTVPSRDASGKLTGKTTSAPDPLAAQVAADGITTNPPSVGSETYVLGGTSARLIASKAAFFVNPTKDWSAWSMATYKVSDTVTAKLSFGAVDNTAQVLYQDSTPWAKGGVLVPGTNPGNTFRAKNSLGQPLFAVPNPSNPSVPLLDSSGNAVLTSDPTNPASGIPFNENVYVRFRPYSSANWPNQTLTNESQTFRTEAKLLGKIGEGWSWTATAAYSRQRADKFITDFDYPNLVAALNGKGGPLANQYFIPFASSLYAAKGSPQWNDPDLHDTIALILHDTAYSSMAVLQGVVSGKFGKLPGGPMGVAFGGELRRETLGETFDSHKVDQTAGYTGFGDPNFNVGATTEALFAEVDAPLMKNNLGMLDLTGAGRYENQTTTHLKSTNPKVSLVYQKSIVSLRASYATAFLAPSLWQRYGSRTSSATLNSTNGDPLYPGTTPNTLIGQRVTGSPTLQPQKSKSYNFGATIRPLKGLSLSADFWQFDYTNLLATLTAQAVIFANPTGPLVKRDPVTNEIVQVTTPYYNAGELKASGVDVAARYTSKDFAIGTFSVSTEATKMRSYLFYSTPGAVPLYGIGWFNTSGTGTTIPSLAGTWSVSWTKANHYASVSGHYISRVNYDGLAVTAYLPSQHYWDFQYSYWFRRWHLKATVGVLNFMNKLPRAPAAAGLGITQAELLEPRSVFGQLQYNF